MMKNYTLMLTAVGAILLGGLSVYAQSTPTPTPTPIVMWDCRNSSWNTELYGFCGGKDAMIKRIEAIPVDLSKRRVFVQITQGSKSGEVKLFERKENNKFTVTTWKSPETLELLPKIDKTVFENKGVNCVGEQVIGVLKEQLNKVHPEVNERKVSSPAEAFSDSVQSTIGEPVRTTVWILC